MSPLQPDNTILKPYDDYEGVCYVPYVKKVSRNNWNSYQTIKEKISFCCESMEKGLKRKDPVGFGKDYSKSTITLFIFGKGESDCDGSCYQAEYGISFCPFCGAKIELDCVKILKEKLKSCKEVVRKVPEYAWEED